MGRGEHRSRKTTGRSLIVGGAEIVLYKWDTKLRGIVAYILFQFSQKNMMTKKVSVA
jgi:hypothetical protein